jgi:hypothetical protein
LTTFLQAIFNYEDYLVRRGYKHSHNSYNEGDDNILQVQEKESLFEVLIGDAIAHGYDEMTQLLLQRALEVYNLFGGFIDDNLVLNSPITEDQEVKLGSRYKQGVKINYFMPLHTLITLLEGPYSEYLVFDTTITEQDEEDRDDGRNNTEESRDRLQELELMKIRLSVKDSNEFHRILYRCERLSELKPFISLLKAWNTSQSFSNSTSSKKQKSNASSPRLHQLSEQLGVVETRMEQSVPDMKADIDLTSKSQMSTDIDITYESMDELDRLRAQEEAFRRTMPRMLRVNGKTMVIRPPTSPR